MKQATDSTSRLAWLVWSMAVVAYGFAVMQRTSLGTSGIAAAEHFGTTVGIVSTFVVLQLATYALGQLPSGMLIDRFGCRAVIVIGSLILAVGQVVIALTSELWVAILARILVGIGDSFLFGPALRLIPAWFAASRVPVLSQLTGLLGQFGQLAAVAALLPLLRVAGWEAAFLSAAAVSLLAALLAAATVRDNPPGQSPARNQLKASEIPSQLAELWRHPATRLGFWVHFTSGFSVNTFAMMWGMPYLIIGQGRSTSEAGTLFGLSVILSAVFGPIMGYLTARHPLRRSNLALTVIWANIGCWVVLLLWPPPAPTWLLVALVTAIAAGGPGTGVGFDYPRTLLPHSRLGTANGIVISGAFSGATLCILLIGLALDTMSPDGNYTPMQLQLAMAIQLPFFALGLICILITRTKLRKMMSTRGVVVPTWREVAHRVRQRRAANKPIAGS